MFSEQCYRRAAMNSRHSRDRIAAMSSVEPRRFVVLFHDLSASAHWDLMIEAGEALATWQLSVPPEVAAASPTTACRIADHRKAYLEYEGPVSGERGSVRIADAGTCAVLSEMPEEWRLALEGRILRGTFRLIRTGAQPDAWRFQRES